MINENWYQTAIKDYGIKEILYEELSEEKKKIGSGGFGKIYKTICNSLGTVAIKEITIDDEVAIKRFIKELKLHSQIKHERIIQFHGISRDEHKEHYLVLEFAKQGNLREFIKNQLKEGEFKWEERKRLAIQIAEGLLYLHNEKNIVHRDLHTTNILINDAQQYQLIIEQLVIDPQKLNDEKNFVLDKRSDIYSLGMVLWEISSCRIPFIREDYKLLSLRIICEGLRERHVIGTPIEYKQIYVDCWGLEPNSRPLIERVLSRLKSMSLEPVFEGDEPLPPDASENILPDDDLTIPTNSVICKRCDSKFTDQNWCNSCESQRFQENFSNWTSKNKSLDELIQYSQLSATKNNTYFEWIDFDRFKDIKVIKDIEDGFYTATWLDGSRELWDDGSQQWERKGPVKIILRRLKCLDINKLKLYLELENVIIYCYGFTQVPSTKSKSTKSYYMIVLKYANVGKLRKYIQNKFPFSWFERLSILKKIVELLHNIHKTNYVHCNFHSGNDDPERRPDTKDLLEELHTFTVSRKSQFEAADSRAYDSEGQRIGHVTSYDNQQFILSCFNWVGKNSRIFLNLLMPPSVYFQIVVGHNQPRQFIPE
ncbi:kinase-like domain-containing protein [Rhizophagus diaphanus]|nr:kinase-like domain-containing protein [Rhizophagus diaphanus] [Rhizophagus sp. MUCL 43196]